MYYLDLFSGIGGFALGAYWAGWRFDEHYFSEVDDYCVKLYSQRFKDAHSLGDIRTISTMGMPQGDWIITGGFPCQDISVAGKGEGISGARSGLWFEMWRIIRILRPRFVIIENVGALVGWFPRGSSRFPPDRPPDMEGDEWTVDIEQHQALEPLIGSLKEIGYGAEWQDIRASDVGAPHERERIWIVAYPIDCADRADRRQERKEKEISRECGSARCSGLLSGTSGNPKDVANTAGAGLSEREKNRQQQSILHAQRGSFEISHPAKQRLQGQESTRGNRGESGLFTECCGWLTEPDVGRLAHGVPRRVDRLKGLGNSIVPEIAELLFGRIGEVMNLELT